MSSVNNHINFGYIANSTNLQDGSNHTLNLSGNLTTSGGYNLTANLTGNTSVTFPTGGTLATLGANLGMFATTISNQLRLTVSDSVGTGYLVFNNAPSFAGLVSTSTFGAAFSDGIAVDYSTGQGRISVGTSDGIGFYNGGVASNPIGAVSSNGIWSLPTLALSTAPSVSAAGTNQATATSLASSVNVITTVASGTGVALPANVTGMVIKVRK
jgi:hypothetical protein